jgi:fatty acid desaturase
MAGMIDEMSTFPLAHYARTVRPRLAAHLFDPVPSRLAWLSLHLAIIALGTVAIVHDVGGWLGAIGFSLLIGHSFAGCAFVGHETLHGVVVRNRLVRYVVGWICFLPFTLSPRLWIAWHNRQHHGNTMASTDPDAYPTLATYRASRLSRIADMFSLGYRRWAGVVTLFIGFTGQSTQVLWRMARQRGYLTAREHLYAVLETALGIAVWTALGLAIGGHAFLFAFVLPLVVGNIIVTSYILTNHSLSPLTEVNDPLVNSLSVTLFRPIEILHLNFGYHVEHHLFPSMSSRYAPEVRDALRAEWPERYQSMNLFRALGRLITTPRVYEHATGLIDPPTGFRASTLLPTGRPDARPSEEAAAESLPLEASELA